MARFRIKLEDGKEYYLDGVVAITPTDEDTCKELGLDNCGVKEIFIDSRVLGFMENSDALSQDFIVFKNRGNVDGRNAIRFILAEPEQSSQESEE